jgi:hypothetical protein
VPRILRQPEPPVDGPRLVVRGAAKGGVADRRAMVPFALVIAIRRGLVPWVHADSPLTLVGLVVSSLAAFATFLVLFRAGHSAAGEVALDTRGATFTKDPGSPLRVAVDWEEVLGYGDGAATHVTLVARGGDFGSYVSIPTPTEADRVAVLAFLDARGMKRLS